MAKTYGEIVKAAKYKLIGSGDRRIGQLMESFELIDASVDTDIYGSGKIINNFENDIAELLGKEKSVFFPSGTMAQQIALRMWCDEKNLYKAAYHPLCHLEIHEKDGLKVLHHIDTILLGNSDRLFTIEDLKAVKEPIACLLIELPQREIGGQLPSFEQLVEISEYCKTKGIRLHLDGARLFEVLPFYKKSAKEICSLFDSVYISFYKGIGGIAGAALAGSAEFIEQSKVWKRRHGGDLISLYPYIVDAKHSMNKRLGKMDLYWQHAMDIAGRLNKVQGIKTIPQVPVCNMFHVYLDAPKETAESILAKIIEKYDLALIINFRAVDDSALKSELYFGDCYELIPPELIDKAFKELEEEFNRIHR